ncbi:MAG: nucleotidyl transferase AbiEii/AbiGii toxin family protein [Solirubrobacterales bacterium]
MAKPSLPEKIVAIDRQLKEARIPHAFGGALALAYCAEPRATIDIDLNVFVPVARIDEVNDALSPLGVTPLESEEDRTALEKDGQCRLWWGRTPVDLFFSYDDVHEAMRETARKVPFGDTELEVLAPEHLVICKAYFDRSKDWVDIEQALIFSDHFDVEEVDRWLHRLVGEEDRRKLRFDELAAQLRD